MPCVSWRRNATRRYSTQQVYRPKDRDVLYLVLDRLSGGSVESLRKQEGRIGEGHAAYIMAQVVDAVRYCHDLNIAVSCRRGQQRRGY